MFRTSLESLLTERRSSLLRTVSTLQSSFSSPRSPGGGIAVKQHLTKTKQKRTGMNQV